MNYGIVNSRRLVWRLVMLLALFLLFFVQAAYAGDEETVAQNFLKFLQSDKVIISGEMIETSQLDPMLAPVAVAQLFHQWGGATSWYPRTETHNRSRPTP